MAAPCLQAVAERRRLEALEAAVARLCSVLRQLLLSVTPAPGPHDPTAPAGGEGSPYASLLLASPERRRGGGAAHGVADGDGSGKSVAVLEDLIDVVRSQSPRAASPLAFQQCYACRSGQLHASQCPVTEPSECASLAAQLRQPASRLA